VQELGRSIESRYEECLGVTILVSFHMKYERYSQEKEKNTPGNLHAYMDNLILKGKQALEKQLKRHHSTNYGNNHSNAEDKNGKLAAEPPHVFDDHDPTYFSKLVAYCSDQVSHKASPNLSMRH